MLKLKKNLPLVALTELRQQLHKHPELSGQEFATSKRIVAFLKDYSPTEIIEDLGGCGVAATYEFGKAGPTVLVRCELDALPIEEINDMEYRSIYPGLGHKCGHDGHMAILVGLAPLLKESKFKSGKVVLLFQPAEEDGRGAVAVLKDKRFASILPDHVFALHNLPGYDLNTVVCKPQAFTASVKSIIIELKGKTAHAGEPEQGINPALAIAELLQKSSLLQRPAEQDDFALITPIQIAMGEEAYGISAGYGVVKLTIRTWTNQLLDELSNRLVELVNAIAAKHQLEPQVKWTQVFAANENESEMVQLVKQAAKMNGLEYINKTEPFKWGEDFGLFTKKFPGAMFGLGAGLSSPALHNPDYDFPDELIETGALMFYHIIDQLLSKS
jgi:amidohydrolase